MRRSGARWRCGGLRQESGWGGQQPDGAVVVAGQGLDTTAPDGRVLTGRDSGRYGCGGHGQDL